MNTRQVTQCIGHQLLRVYWLMLLYAQFIFARKAVTIYTGYEFKKPLKISANSVVVVDVVLN